MPEQEHSIRARSDELFVEDTPAFPAGSSKPFKVYLRETPARPLPAALKALFWLVALVVGALFLAALWRVSHRHGSRPPSAGAAASLEVEPGVTADSR
jgi:hypothetical protein